MMTGREGVRLGEAAIATYSSVCTDFQQELELCREALSQLEAKLSSSCRELSEALLTSARPEFLAELDTRYRLECRRKPLDQNSSGYSFKNAESVSLADRRHRAEIACRRMGVRQESIHEIDDFRNQDQLLDPESGLLGGELEQLRSQHQIKNAEFDRIWSTDFARVYHETPPKRGFFQTFWRGLTFAETREKRTRDALPAKLGFSSWNDLVAHFRAVEQERRTIFMERDLREKRLLALQALLGEYDENAEWLTDFDGKLLRTIKEEVTTFLLEQTKSSSGLDVFWREAFARATPAAKPMWAKLQAQVAQVSYLNITAKFLLEERTDSEREIRKIESVLPFWRRKTYSYLNGDKSKWLVKLPALKSASALKKVRWCRQIRENLSQYQDWNDFSLYRQNVSQFLAMDAFTWGSNDPMPYDGFLRSLFPDVAEHRRRLGLSKGNFEPYKQVDLQYRQAQKLAEREARQAEREMLRQQKAEGVAAAAAAAAAITAAALLEAQAAENEARLAEERRRRQEELDDDDDGVYVETSLVESTDYDRS